MEISRRGLLRALLATTAASTVDFEQLLWVPKPIITVPAMPIMGQLLYTGNYDWLYRNEAFLMFVQSRKPMRFIGNPLQCPYQDVPTPRV